MVCGFGNQILNKKDKNPSLIHFGGWSLGGVLFYCRPWIGTQEHSNEWTAWWELPYVCAFTKTNTPSFFFLLGITFFCPHQTDKAAVFLCFRFSSSWERVKSRGFQLATNRITHKEDRTV